MIHYILLLIIMGLIWIVVTNWFRNRIKKLWLYILFPVFIYSLPVLYVSIREPKNQFSILPLLVIYSYFIVKLIKGLNTRDVLIIPLLVITLLIIIITIDQVLFK